MHGFFWYVLSKFVAQYVNVLRHGGHIFVYLCFKAEACSLPKFFYIFLQLWVNPWTNQIRYLFKIESRESDTYIYRKNLNNMLPYVDTISNFHLNCLWPVTSLLIQYNFLFDYFYHYSFFSSFFLKLKAKDLIMIEVTKNWITC